MPGHRKPEQLSSSVTHDDKRKQALERCPAGPTCVYRELIRIDYVTESPNVSGDDRAVLPLPGPVGLAVQVEEPT